MSNTLQALQQLPPGSMSRVKLHMNITALLTAKIHYQVHKTREITEIFTYGQANRITTGDADCHLAWD
jgi:hypothetical protein